MSKYKELVRFAIETAFNDENNNVECLLRCLLRQKQITLENGMYIRPDLPYEKGKYGMRLVGVNHKREKDFFIDNEHVDEYVLALEKQLKEYNEAKNIFKKYNLEDKTMYDCIIEMQKELDEYRNKEE